jgi:hypothetical protein
MSEANIARLLGEWWTATEALSLLVPPERFVAEMDPREEEEDKDEDGDGYFDETVIFDVKTEPAFRTNSTQGWRSIVSLSCLSVDYEVSRQIGSAIVAEWANKGYTGTGNTITCSKPTGQIETTQDDETGVWDTAVSFEMWHQGAV